MAGFPKWLPKLCEIISETEIDSEYYNHLLRIFVLFKYLIPAVCAIS